MKAFKIVLFSFLLIIMGNQLVAQTAIKKFTEDKDKFLIELTDFMNQDDKKLAEEFIVPFTTFWNTASINEEQRKAMYSVANAMLKKKLKAFPEFKNYLESYQRFINSGRSMDEFNAWYKSLDLLVKKSNKASFVRFVEMTNNLFIGNQMYNSNTTIWKSSSSNFVFKYDSTAYIEYAETDLICLKYSDSTVIAGTKGVFYPTNNMWFGENGKVDWRRAGFASDSVYAELQKYSIEMKSSDFEADSVTFFNKKFFDYPLKGKIIEKILADVTPDKATYPRFDSYSKRLFIKALFENIDYDGGFSMAGAKFYAIGTADQKAKVIFYREGSVFAISKSESFVVKKDRISSDNSEISIYIDADSIYHPMIEMKYLDKKQESNGNITKELSLLRSDNGIGNSPFYDSYHMVDMYVEAVYWKTDEPKVDFAMFKGMKTESECYFESANYYDQWRYEKLQGIDNEHPLKVIRDFAKKYGNNEFPIMALSNYMTIQIEIVSAMVINLAKKGFVRYNFDTKMVSITDRLFHYINSRERKTDYDIIKFNSMVSKQQFETNASLSLLNNDITIQGVEQVFLSDSHNVVIIPYEQKVSLRKNRDFDFQGKIIAGLFEYYGKDFNFIYDEFKINLNNVDSFTFKVKGTEVDPETGEPELVRVRTMIEGVTGDLLVDHPRNKSGVKRLAQYPIFNSKKDSYAFYDKPSIYNGVYNRENFFYQLEPFSFDSIDKFSTAGIEFNGYFASAGIFPDFDDNLTVMPDYSLGFTRKAPSEGFPVYEGKGTYFNEIKLSNEGLHGNGELKYLTSTTGSTDFTFFPDSTNALAYKFDVAEQLDKDPEYPDVKGMDVRMLWRPYEDIMSDTKIETPIRFYNNQCVLNGRTDLTPNGMTGAGLIKFPKAEIEALLFKFKQHEFDTDTCDFRLKSGENLEDVTLSTLDYKGHVDLKEQKGHFKANSEASKVEFPVNQYICYMDEFIWWMDKEKIDLFTSNTEKLSGDDKNITTKNGEEMNLSGSQFVSIHPAQDSLRFFSPKAEYDIKNNIINAYDVKFILVADAAIFPDSGKVTVLKKAEIKTLEKSKIMANTATKYHEFYNCNTNIYARKNYGASGYYDYVDETEKKQKIYFEKIIVDTTYQTYANGKIEKEASFTLSPYFEYYGNIKLIASNQFINFNGNSRIKHSCDKVPISWLNFSADINPLEIYIPVNKTPKDQNESRIYAGIMQGKDSSCVYSAFLSRRAKDGDDTLIVANGFLYYDKDVKEYKIADMGRIKENKFTGNYLSINTYCDVYGEGVINLSNNVSQVKVDAYGTALNKTKKGETSLDLVLGIDFFFSDKANKLLEETLLADVTAQPANLNSETYYKALVNKVGVAQADKLISDLNVNGAFKKIPDELIHNMFFSEVSLKWDPNTNSYISNGQLSIGSVNKTQLNRVYKGWMQVEKKKSGDAINIYIEDGSKNWFFFSYSRGIMGVASSSKEFLTIINETKPDDRGLKGEKGQEAYVYQTTTEKRKNDFLKDMGQ
ncbi:MAG: hypothetical protein WCK02_06870 [Bacteroidota bacterium]